MVEVEVVVKAVFELKGDCPVGIADGKAGFSRAGTVRRAAVENGLAAMWAGRACLAGDAKRGGGCCRWCIWQLVLHESGGEGGGRGLLDGWLSGECHRTIS